MDRVHCEWVKVMHGLEMGVEQHREISDSGECKSDEKANTVYKWEHAWSVSPDELSNVEVNRTQFAKHHGLGQRHQISSRDHGGRKSTCGH